MKKIVVLLSLLLFICPVFAINETMPYRFDRETMKFTFSQTSQNKTIEKYTKKAQNATKIDNKIKYYKKILEKNPDYMPAVYELMFLYSEKSNSPEVLNYAYKLRELNSNHLIPDDIITDIIARCNYRLKRYNDAAVEYEKITDPVLIKRNYLIMSDLYLQLGNYDNVIKYATKITSSDSDYYKSLELLYTAYKQQNSNKIALKYAKELIKLKPNDAQNYLRAAFCNEDNKPLKLEFLYIAKRILLSTHDPQIYSVDNLIAGIEQSKIDNAFRKLTDFVVKPDWFNIAPNNSYDINFYIQNYSLRQDNFFKSANNCISKYNGQNLVKCFEALNVSEERKTAEYKELEKQKKEEQRALEQQLMMEKLLRMERQIYYNRYYYYPHRYYRPYYYW